MIERTEKMERLKERRGWSKENVQRKSILPEMQSSLKRKTSAQTKFIWVIRSDKERRRDSIALLKLLVKRVGQMFQHTVKKTESKKRRSDFGAGRKYMPKLITLLNQSTTNGPEV